MKYATEHSAVAIEVGVDSVNVLKDVQQEQTAWNFAMTIAYLPHCEICY